MQRETFNKQHSFGVVGRYDVKDSPPKPDELGAFRWRDAKHTPYNKRHGTVDSRVVLHVFDNPQGVNTDEATRMSAPVVGWTEIQLTEHTDTRHRTQSRTISVCLSADARKALIAYLTAAGGE